MKFDRITAAKLRDELNAAVQGVAEKYGIQVRFGNCTFSDTEINYKVQAKTTDTEALDSVRLKEWQTYAKLYGFEVADMGKEFTARGEKYAVHGLNLKRPKFSLQAKRLSDGKIFLFSADPIVRFLHPEKVGPADFIKH